MLNMKSGGTDGNIHQGVSHTWDAEFLNVMAFFISIMKIVIGKMAEGGCYSC